MNRNHQRSDSKVALVGNTSAFTLVEILVVIGIIVVLMALTLPVTSGVRHGVALAQSGGAFVTELETARLEALSRNRAVQIRFYTYGNLFGEPRVRAIQALVQLDNGQFYPLDKLYELPDTVVAAPELSTLLDPAFAATPDEFLFQGQDDIPGRDDADYIAFMYRPDGSTTLGSSMKWYITLVDEGDVSKEVSEIKNYVSIMVDPINGTIRSMRPGIVQ